uniref:Ankyrin n=1 Tax=Rheinheimera sp. BAL341 TaxID=1708203 RepID=A0A486XRC1_9GAMM
MLEISYLAFYVLLHLVLAALLVPLVYGISRSGLCPPPGWMLRIWTGVALILFVLPMILLQPWALDQQLLPWFHGSMAQVLTTTEPAALTGHLIASESRQIRQHHFALLSQILYFLAPVFWLWLFLPLCSAVKVIGLLRSYRASRWLVRTAQACELPPEFLAVAAPLPVKVHPEIHSPMLLGLRQPLILLPAAMLQQCSHQELNHVLRHEQSHWQQGDLAAFYLQQWLGIFCWWSPCWRLLGNEWLRCRELRADAQVLAALPDKSAQLAYAQTLLNCSAAKPSASPSPVSITSGSDLALRWLQQPLLAVRIQAVLTPSPLRYGAVGFGALVGAALLLLMAVALLSSQWQLADLPKRHAQIRLSQLQPLSELLKAVAANDAAKVQQFLDQGAPFNLPMPGQGSPLMVAVRKQHTEMVELLLAAGADVNVSSKGDGNALIIATQLGDLTMAKRLLQAGADVNAVVLADETALINASYHGDLAMVQLLLDAGALINLQVETPLSDGRLIRSALNRAANAEMRAYLLAQGAR